MFAALMWVTYAAAMALVAASPSPYDEFAEFAAYVALQASAYAAGRGRGGLAEAAVTTLLLFTLLMALFGLAVPEATPFCRADGCRPLVGTAFVGCSFVARQLELSFAGPPPPRS